MKRRDYTSYIGHKYNSWTVLEIAPKRNGNIMGLCRCECGAEKVLSLWTIANGKTKRCKSCSVTLRHRRRFQPCGGISQSHWTSLKANAASRGIPFNIEMQTAWNLFESQGGRCALSGVPLVLELKSKRRIREGTQPENTASLDRIDSGRPYEVGNIQWVHKDLNWMKLNHRQDVFIDWCKKVADFNTNCEQACAA